jgi:SAM-dependent methyltransferase
MGVFTVANALRTAAIDAGHELGLFEAIDQAFDEPMTLAQLAARLNVRPTHRFIALVDALVAIGVIERAVPASDAPATSDAPTTDSRIDAAPKSRIDAAPKSRIDAAPKSRIDALARYSYTRVPDRSPYPMVGGWGAIAEVIRTDTPLAIEDPDIAQRYQRHLVTASAPAARELATMLAPLVAVESARIDGAGIDGVGIDGARIDGRVRAIDIGAGAGAYSRALLEADPRVHVTLVDHAEVIELARTELADFADRTRFLAGDARRIDLTREGADDGRDDGRDNQRDDRRDAVGDVGRDGGGFDLAIVANVLHLHAPAVCLELCAVAAHAVRTGGIVAIVDLGRGTLEGEMFALNMALYTEGGSVYSVDQIRTWLCDAGLELVASTAPHDAASQASGAIERRLKSAPEMIVMLARRI